MVSHTFVLPVSFFAGEHILPSMLCVSLNILQHFFLPIIKEIYATNSKNHLRLSGGSLALYSEVNLNLHVFRQCCTTIFTEQDIKNHLSCNHIFPMHEHAFIIISLTSISHSFKKQPSKLPPPVFFSSHLLKTK